MRIHGLKAALVGVTAATLLLGAACSSDDGGDADSESTATATEAAAATEAMTATTAATEAMTETAAATPEGPTIADLDGLVCSGGWTNQTFGSTGDFSASFATSASGGSVTLELGGNVFGGQGGTVEAPLTVDGDSTVINADLDFLGMAKLAFDGANALETVLESPPALGEGSKATITDFAFDGESLNFGVDIEFANNGGTARSVVESTCS